ncbi:MAG: leucyl aminopeptidase [Thermodesulfovibrionales bacterium]
MQIEVVDLRELTVETEALILPLCEEEEITVYKDINDSLNGLLKDILRRREFEGKEDQTYLIHTQGRIRPERIILTGLGKRGGLNKEKVRRAGGRSFSLLKDLKINDAVLSTRYLNSAGLSPNPFLEGGLLSLYRFQRYKKEEESKLDRFIMLSRPSQETIDSLRWTEKVIKAVNFVKDMVNTPANDMTPSELARIAFNLSGERVSVTVLEREDAEKEGMGAYLAVAKGSSEPPKFIVLNYRGSDSRPIVVIGKSITFDSGGISIKPSEGMEKMKYDMAGGAVVLGIIKLVSEAMLPLNVIGILPATENLPGGHATRPGDIVRTCSGKTVEIINTDAEGRLVLADAIGFAKRFNPQVIIDVATLTGACSIALGNEAAAIMGNDLKLMERLKIIGDETYERVWPMPLFGEYGEYLKSDFADIKNSAGRIGSLVTAAYFLKEFAGETPWVHIDIASTAWTEKDKAYMTKGATAFGLRLLSNFIKEM